MGKCFFSGVGKRANLSKSRNLLFLMVVVVLTGGCKEEPSDTNQTKFEAVTLKFKDSGLSCASTKWIYHAKMFDLKKDYNLCDFDEVRDLLIVNCNSSSSVPHVTGCTWNPPYATDHTPPRPPTPPPIVMSGSPDNPNDRALIHITDSTVFNECIATSGVPALPFIIPPRFFIPGDRSRMYIDYEDQLSHAVGWVNGLATMNSTDLGPDWDYYFQNTDVMVMLRIVRYGTSGKIYCRKMISPSTDPCFGMFNKNACLTSMDLSDIAVREFGSFIY